MGLQVKNTTLQSTLCSVYTDTDTDVDARGLELALVELYTKLGCLSQYTTTAIRDGNLNPHLRVSASPALNRRVLLASYNK